MKFKVELPESELKCWKENLNIFESKIPTFNELAFKDKWNSIYYRYESARNFLILAIEPDYESLFEINNCSANTKKYFEICCKKDFYEAALMNYNILIDYSWQLVYFCFEFVSYSKDKQIDLDNWISIEESRNLLNKLEKNVSCPGNDECPFKYFKKFKDNSEYIDIFELINSFWNNFKNSNLRKYYNLIKHCGNLIYQEIEEIKNSKIRCNAKIEGQSIAINVKDIKDSVSLKKLLEELKDFDNNILMDYLCNLLNKLKSLMNISDLVYL